MIAIRTKKVPTIVLLSLLGIAHAYAGTIEVSPVTIELSSGTTTSIVSVTNHNSTPTPMQVRGFTWSQNGDADELERTDDLIVSPPIFELQPGQSQTIRLMVRKLPSGIEATYRLIVDELPNNQVPGSIVFGLRLSLPIFVAPSPQSGNAHLMWSLIPTGIGTAELRVRNDGARHEKLTELSLHIPGSDTVKPAGLANPYVLSGSTRSWKVSVGATRLLRSRVVQLTGRGLNGTFDVPITVAP